MDEIKYKPIGVIRSPFKEPQGTPIQPSAAEDVDGMVELFPEYVEGLEGLEGFSHIILIYHFHLAKRALLKVKPFMDDRMHGLFSTRAPCRPNPIGISVVRLIGIQKNILYIRDVDIVDNTPLLDIKPYAPQFDVRTVRSIGWLEKSMHKLPGSRDDGRFVK